MSNIDRLALNIAASTVRGLLLAGTLSAFASNANATPVESVVHRFSPNLTEGVFPVGKLVEDATGALYGTAAAGSLNGGTAFKFVPPAEGRKTGQLTVLYRFTESTGSQPQGSLVLGANGALFGTTIWGGGASSDGTVFELLPSAASGATWREVVIHSFSRFVDGATPAAGLLMGKNGMLFGALTVGPSTTPGTTTGGAIFAFTPPLPGQTAWTETIIHRFKGGTDGLIPNGSLISDDNGALYGTTLDSGLDLPAETGFGTIFKLTPPAAGKSAWTKTILHRFKGGADGGYPGPLLRDSQGTLYGTTTLGAGTVFKLNPPSQGKGVWTLTTIYRFTGGAEGQRPSSLIMDKTGALLGTTSVVFKLTPPTAPGGKWMIAVLHTFGGGSDGTSPNGVVVSRNGPLFGVTNYGGNTGCKVNPYPGGCGTIFKLTE